MDKKKNIDKDTNIDHLIQMLGSKNGMQRKKARKLLIKNGEKAIDPLLELLNSPLHILRWEAMKALKEIGDQSLIPVFISMLEDDKSDIRWIAAEGLIKLGRPAIEEILISLIKKTDAVFLLHGAHHVFYELREKEKLPEDFPINDLLASLKYTNPKEKITLTIYKILNNLRE